MSKTNALFKPAIFLKLTPYPPLLRIEGAKPYSPSLREEKGLGDELIFLAIVVFLRFSHLVIGAWDLEFYFNRQLSYGVLSLVSWEIK
jgi:hypothetical protein